MDLNLKGKRALVTGSTSGIGASIATILAREGVAVAINGRSAERAADVLEAIRQVGGKAVLAIGDVATNEGADAVAKAALEGLGGVDILVNNTGGRATEAGASSWFDVPPEAWAATYEKNVIAAVRMMQHLVPAMRDRGWGRIIQISSQIGTTPTSSLPDYAGSKAAMNNMALGASKALANTGVTVNTVAPGMIDTPAIENWFRNIGDQQGWGGDRDRTVAYVLENYVHQTVNRIGQVEDVGNLAAYIASPLSDHISGAIFRVDGGSTPSVA
ncbi:MAG: 3-oxoacyl-[acyl-carrier-protein] reductase [Caulobacteraceae bacterium]|nr:3-oxoacyl-[acyl-carrier-protein] reductase [Caulobacteraceae bacterium]